MALSELESISAISDYKMRTYLLELLEYKKQINQELKQGVVSVQREEDLRAALEMIDNNIQRVRFSGVF